MPLLPLRSLPVNDSHEGPLTIRVEVRPTGCACIYVRRESDKKAWHCRVRSLQEILAPTQRARPLNIAAVATCLYDGVSYDSTSTSAYASMPIKLVRREVAFTQPETWTDGGYRLTMRVAVRSSAVAIPTMVGGDSTGGFEAVAVPDSSDDDVVFGFNFVPSDIVLDHRPVVSSGGSMQKYVKLELVDTAFPNSYLNWSASPDKSMAKCVDDGFHLDRDHIKYRYRLQTLVTLHLVHARDPVAFTFSVNSQAMAAVHSTTYQSVPGGDIYHTIAQYVLKVPELSLVQVVLLPGSACALEGTTITIREQSME